MSYSPQKPKNSMRLIGIAMNTSKDCICEQTINPSVSWEHVAGCGVFDDLSPEQVFELLGSKETLTVIDIIDNDRLFYDDKLWIIEDRFHRLINLEVMDLLIYAWRIVQQTELKIIRHMLENTIKHGILDTKSLIDYREKTYLYSKELIPFDYSGFLKRCQNE